MSKEIKQYSMLMVDMGTKEFIKGHEKAGNRPFFVISSTKYNMKSKTPIGFFASTSSKKTKNKYSIEIDDNGSINISQIRTLSEERFLYCIQEIHSSKLESIILSTFINQIVLNGQFDDTDFVEIFSNKQEDIKLENFKNSFGK
jgi:mRNA-degrading endonuclease toxin of MazEF toxin-antitoxin module